MAGMRWGNWLKAGFLGSVGAGLAASAAVAALPQDRGIGFQPAATEVMRDVTTLHNVLLVIITLITALVLALLLWVIIRYNRKMNPAPRKFSHNVLVEIVWTVVPALILVFISVPSFQLLYKQDVIPEPDLTIKTVGQTWYWDYVYPDHGGFEFSSLLLEGDPLPSGAPNPIAGPDGVPKLFAVDNPMVVPVGKVVQLQVTSSPTGVIHSWALPAFGVKMDAIPGRLNVTWFKVDQPGDYHGQCSEICGIRHAYMPIHVRALPEPEFNAWVAQQQAAYGIAAAPQTAPIFASAQ